MSRIPPGVRCSPLTRSVRRGSSVSSACRAGSFQLANGLTVPHESVTVPPIACGGLFMSRRILLADDSVTIQKVIELTFMDDDYEVKAVSNGDEALAILAASRFDFVIADVHMPGANGFEV